MLQELNIIYESLLNNRKPSLSPLSIQYVDYAYWHRKVVESDMVNKQIEYWSTKLKDFEELHLPTDFPRPKLMTNTGRTISYFLDKKTLDKITDLSISTNTTVYMVLLSAFGLLLSQYSRQEDFVIGTGSASRVRTELEKVMGFFVNTLPIRFKMNSEECFLDLLHSIKKTSIEAYMNQDLPFDILVDRVGVNREPDRSPIFQVMFMLQDANENADLMLHDIDCEKVETYLDVAMFDLVFDIFKSDKGVNFKVQYNTSLYKESTILSFMDNFKNILDNFLSAPNKKLFEFNCLSDKEYNLLTNLFNATDVNFPLSSSLVDRFDSICELFSNNSAVSANNKNITYAEIHEKSNKLAQYIFKRIKSDNKNSKKYISVAILMERTELLVISIFAVFRLGLSYVPIDPKTPVNRLQYMIDMSNSVLVLSDKNEIDVDLECINVKNIKWKTIAYNQINHAKSDAIANIIFTSGSTGKPKGVRVAHYNIMNVVCHFAQKLNFNETSTLLSVTNVSFDIFGLEIFMPLLTGGCLIFAPENIILDKSVVDEYINKSCATVIQATPSFWSLMIDYLEDGKLNKVLCGGEVLPPILAEKLLDICSELYNVYGPTETTIWSTSKRVLSKNDLSIGTPISNTRIYILDQHLRPVPRGCLGELYITGAGVTQGYNGLDKLTQERFILNPYSNGESFYEKMYRTGDLVYLNNDCEICFSGRSDNQVKVRGHRIEVGEVENIINEYQFVLKSVVVAINEKLVAFIIPSSEDNQINSDILLSHMHNYLPDYMIPSQFIRVKSFPLTTSGKIDRRVLIERQKKGEIGKDTEYFKAENELEATIVSIWENALKIDKISVEDNFFLIGGHSLLIPQILIKMNDTLGSSLTIKNFIENPSVRAIAKYLNLEVLTV